MSLGSKRPKHWKISRPKKHQAMEDISEGYVAGIHLHTKNLSMHREVHISTYLQVTLFWDLLCLQPKTCPALWPFYQPSLWHWFFASFGFNLPPARFLVASDAGTFQYHFEDLSYLSWYKHAAWTSMEKLLLGTNLRPSDGRQEPRYYRTMGILPPHPKTKIPPPKIAGKDVCVYHVGVVGARMVDGGVKVDGNYRKSFSPEIRPLKSKKKGQSNNIVVVPQSGPLAPFYSVFLVASVKDGSVLDSSEVLNHSLRFLSILCTGPGLLGSGFTDPGSQYCQQIQNLRISGLWYVAAIICQDWLLAFKMCVPKGRIEKLDVGMLEGAWCMMKGKWQLVHDMVHDD